MQLGSKERKRSIKAIESAQKSLAILENLIEGKKHFGGEQMGFLDLVVGWIAHWLNTMEEAGGMKLLDAERFPSLHEWAQSFIEIPVIQESIPPRQEFVDYFDASISNVRSLAVA